MHLKMYSKLLGVNLKKLTLGVKNIVRTSIHQIWVGAQNQDVLPGPENSQISSVPLQLPQPLKKEDSENE
jgi:hypothetical protein